MRNQGSNQQRGNNEVRFEAKARGITATFGERPYSLPEIRAAIKKIDAKREQWQPRGSRLTESLASVTPAAPSLSKGTPSPQRPPVGQLLAEQRDNIALILIGMPGIEKWFSRYAELYSRVGFAHEYRPLAQEELNFVLELRWHKFGQTLNSEDFTDSQAIAAVARITRGNFRLIDRLFTQIERVPHRRH